MVMLIGLPVAVVDKIAANLTLIYVFEKNSCFSLTHVHVYVILAINCVCNSLKKYFIGSNIASFLFL